MSEKAAAEALRSNLGLVVIEAPAGCGKTFQAATYAGDRSISLRPGRMLILAHTHAACDVIAKRAANTGNVEIRTIDSLVMQIGTVYHRAIDLPSNVGDWARQNGNDYDEIARRVSSLMKSSPAIAEALAARYPVILCDEHQDSSPHQHSVLMQLHEASARLRIFGDPMQSIYSKKSDFDAATAQWSKLCDAAQAYESLELGHRWINTAPDLGEWIQSARITLREGGAIDLRGKLPKGVHVIRANNQAQGYGNFRLRSDERWAIDEFISHADPLVVLSSQNKTVAALRGVFARRLPIWEGHTRSALDVLVRDISTSIGKPSNLGRALAEFIGKVAVGFTTTGYVKRFLAELEAGCCKSCRGKPLKIQGLAKILVSEPDHRGVAKVLRSIEQLATDDAQFRDVKIDHRQEFREAIQLEKFSDANTGHSEISRRRAALRPSPPRKAISTVHKAKGLEFDRALVMPCDASHFANKQEHRCLLYVALSRPTRELAIVVPTLSVSPLFRT